MSNYKEIVRRVSGKAQKISDEATDMLGLIIGHYTPQGIITKRFKGKPIKEYKLLEYMQFEDTMTITDAVTCTSSHSHKVITPPQLLPLKEGDIVLMAYVEEEFIVIGRLVKDYE